MLISLAYKVHEDGSVSQVSLSITVINLVGLISDGQSACLALNVSNDLRGGKSELVVSV